MIWSIDEGRGGTPFLSTKGHEGPRRKPMQGHDLVLVDEGLRRTPFCPRKAAKGREENLCRVIIWAVLEGRGEKTFYDPRRATKGHEENLCKGIIWSVHEGRGRTPLLSTEGHGGPRRKPSQGHNLVYPRRAGENTFFCPRRATKGHEENLRKVIIWSVDEGPRELQGIGDRA